jgi:hypothetical protein
MHAKPSRMSSSGVPLDDTTREFFLKLFFFVPIAQKTVDVTVPEIEEMRLAHYVTMGSECTASLAKYLDNM